MFWSNLAQELFTTIANVFLEFMGDKVRHIGYDFSVNGNLLFQEILRFTQSDLLSNREGSMSKAQVERAIRRRNTYLVFLTVLGTLALAIGFAFILSQLVCTVVAILFAGICFFLDYTSYRAWTQVAANGHVTLVQDKLKYRVVEVMTNSGPKNDYYMSVGKLEHNLNDIPKLAREKIQAMEGQMVNVYYLPQVHRWLSMELVETIISDE